MDSKTIATLPGGEIVELGLRDLAQGRESIESLALQIAATRFRRAGLGVQDAG